MRKASRRGGERRQGGVESAVVVSFDFVSSFVVFSFIVFSFVVFSFVVFSHGRLTVDPDSLLADCVRARSADGACAPTSAAASGPSADISAQEGAGLPSGVAPPTGVAATLRHRSQYVRAPDARRMLA